MRHLPYRVRVGILVATAAVAVGAAAVLPPVAQDAAYHDFADTRVVWGIGHFGDVITNAPYVVVGLLGFAALWAGRNRRAGAFHDPQEARAYVVFFAGVTLTGFGSTWYHLAPDNDSLLWDRLPMSVAFMGLFSAMIAERVSRRAGMLLLGPLLALGVASVLVWYVGERAGAGDLRLYGLVQFYPILALVLMLVLFRPRYTHAGYLWLTIASYAAAKLAELLDRPIYAATRVASGHNIKHCLSALAVAWVAVMLHRRSPIPQAAG